MRPILLLLACLSLTSLAVMAPQSASAQGDGPDQAVDAAPAPTPTSTDPGKHCLGGPTPKLFMGSVLGIKYGDWGLEHQLRVGVCAPLIKGMGPLFDHTFIQGGLLVLTSPIYVMPGGFFSIAPLSILQLHVEAAPVFYWPIGVAAAGYYPLAGYGSDYTKASLLAEDGGTATGWYVRFGPTLQLAVPLGPVRLIVLDTLRFEHVQIGPADFYFHNRNDLPAARSEWFIDNSALLLVEIPVHPNVNLRLGANDALVMNVGGRNLSNAVRGVAMVQFKRIGPRIVDFMPVVTMGGRTNHPVRQGDFNMIIALSFSVDMTPGAVQSKAAAKEG